MARRYKARPGWTRLDGGTCKLTARYGLDGTGFWIEHCGHPTAIFPYAGLSPEGDLITTSGIWKPGQSRGGVAFSTLNEAQEALESLAAKRGWVLSLDRPAGTGPAGDDEPLRLKPR